MSLCISVTLTDLKTNTRKSSSSVQSGDIFTLCRRAFVSVTCSWIAAEPRSQSWCVTVQEVNRALNSVWTVCLCLRQILVPLRMFLFPLLLDFMNWLSVTSYGRQGKRCLITLITRLCSAVFDWQASVWRPCWGLWETDDVTSWPVELNPLCPLLPLSTSCSPLSTDYCLKKKKESSSNQKQRCV